LPRTYARGDKGGFINQCEREVRMLLRVLSEPPVRSVYCGA
jgi:hypothetical protein